MKVLITGHTGFIGRNISRHLAMQGHEIVGLSRSLSEESCFDAQVSCDLGEPHLCESIIGHKKLKGVEIVIHASSILADNKNLESFDFFYANLRIIENTVKLCKSLQPKMIINLSSVAVYPNIDGDFSTDNRKEFCDYIGITEEYYMRVVDGFVNTDLFKKTDGVWLPKFTRN